ncbi:NAD-dependent epimerase/dehydratase family protein [Egicoccus halophilus]|uniref:NAD-dependent epimerase n=1 Tax=Egicoccus halophilus TaxID=1670830 RepID=A0A8J3AAC8_9ACTN|nr:NAD-dependent epimerase/dehydratase family protein [Egicoccus halophilus]GGI06075.1 NAD-dependent epimerase [Egicoccus halophilus]
MSTPWLVTGAAGFIGMHLTERLAAVGQRVVAVDDLQATYEPALTAARWRRVQQLDAVEAVPLDVTDEAGTAALLARVRPPVVIHLAARAGVRGSHLEPMAYLRSNVLGFANVLEQARATGVGHVVYASSSSVYGDDAPVPFRVEHPADHPVSVYAATKRADELLAHSYAHAFGLPCTGLRLFTVYGPWGRPDMAYFAFADAIHAGRPLQVFGDGSALRDFTYVDDVVDAILGLADQPPTGPGGADVGGADAPWRVYNVGHGGQATVAELIEALEQRLGRSARRVHLPAHTGDVRRTHADTTPLRERLGRSPATPLAAGLDRFAAWFLDHRAGVPAPTTTPPTSH